IKKKTSAEAEAGHSSETEKGEKSSQANEPVEKIATPFNGKNLNGWNFKPSGEQGHWTVGIAKVDPQNPKDLILGFAPNQPGELVNLKGHGVDVYSQPKFGDCTIELEFMIPKGSNSGVYVMGEYEVQVIDSFGKESVGQGDLGAIYGAAAPKVNAAKAPGQWQSLIIKFQAPRFADGKKSTNARFLKVVLNGQTIHENLEVKGPTPGGLTGKEAALGPLMFQGDHGPVAYRNIKITTASAGEAHKRRD
ncbi:MAG: 3-keto-disaccharide hydrolase, partial [Thermoguttaceae bacterium]